MPIVEVDKKGKVLIPKEIRKIAKIRSKEKFFMRLENNKLIVERIGEKSKTKKDPLIELMENPIHASPEKIKKVELEKIEEELWLSR